MKMFKYTAALFLAAAILAPGAAVAEPPAKAQRGPVFPMYLVSTSVDRNSFTVRYYSANPGQQFCVVYADVALESGERWKRWNRPRRCFSADSYGNATVTFHTHERGPHIVSVVIPSGAVRSDVLDLEKLHPVK